MTRIIAFVASFIAAFVLLAALPTAASADWSQCWFGVGSGQGYPRSQYLSPGSTPPPYNGQAGTGVLYEGQLHCNVSNSIAVGAQLWDATTNQEVDDMGHGGYINSTLDEAGPVNTWGEYWNGSQWVSDGYPCAPGHKYSEWVYGWVDGVYRQQLLGPYGPVC